MYSGSETGIRDILIISTMRLFDELYRFYGNRESIPKEEIGRIHRNCLSEDMEYWGLLRLHRSKVNSDGLKSYVDNLIRRYLDEIYEGFEIITGEMIGNSEIEISAIEKIPILIETSK